jgi:hypothetical protein
MPNWLKWTLGAIGALALIFAFLLFIPIKQAHADVPSVTMLWTAPADDDSDPASGPASTYEMRWSTTPVGTDTLSWWNAANVVPNMPQPSAMGETDSVTVAGNFVTGTHYYFIIKACDEVPNCSPYSAVADVFIPDTVPPSPILDLRVRP